MKKEPIIQVKNASKSYPIAGKEFMALKQIDLSLNKKFHKIDLFYLKIKIFIMPFNMVTHKCRNEVIRMIITILHS